MKKISLFVAFLSLAGASALAQNLNPTVEVTNDYQREATGIEKPAQLLEMPDSVLRFNLDFDYAVRTTPYQGAYEFKPYRVQLRPMPRPSREGTLYLSGGAGYSAHPELTVVWTPLKSQRVRVNLYGDHHSYIGLYRGAAPKNDQLVFDGEPFSGAALYSKAGADVLVDWTGGQFLADACYQNVYGQDDIAANNHHLVGFRARLSGRSGKSFMYEGGTRLSQLWVADNRQFHSVNDIRLGARFGANLVRVDLGLETVSWNGESALDASLAPHYVFSLGGFNLDLGILVSNIFRSTESFYPSKSDFLFPDARVSYEVVPKSLTLYASATGGDHMNVYSDMLQDNPFLMNFLQTWVLDNSTERFNLAAGLRGTLFGRFYYDAKVGWALWKNGLLWAVAPNGGLHTPSSIMYADMYHLFYVDLVAGWKSENIEAEGKFSYKSTNLDEVYGMAPPAVKGSLKAVYIWGGRVRAGVTLAGMTERVTRLSNQANDYLHVPGFMDLGLLGDLQMSSKVGVWLKLGNLLDQPVSYVPFHVEKGPWFTVGARLTF